MSNVKFEFAKGSPWIGQSPPPIRVPAVFQGNLINFQSINESFSIKLLNRRFHWKLRYLRYYLLTEIMWWFIDARKVAIDMKLNQRRWDSWQLTTNLSLFASFNRSAACLRGKSIFHSPPISLPAALSLIPSLITPLLPPSPTDRTLRWIASLRR